MTFKTVNSVRSDSIFIQHIPDVNNPLCEKMLVVG